MITTNVIFRVFHFRYKTRQGTCFTIDVDGKQYLITAKHCIEGISKSDRFEIFGQGEWKYLDLIFLGASEDKFDTAVFRPGIQLSPNFPFEPSSANIFYGQEVYFLGFPYSIGGNVGEVNREFPLPLVKRAIVSMILSGDNEPESFYLDGHNNPGFSGSPVIFRDPSKPLSENNPYKVAAIISANRITEEFIYDEEKKPIHLTYRYNTGIIIAHDINHALKIIKANPDGYEIQNQ